MRDVDFIKNTRDELKEKLDEFMKLRDEHTRLLKELGILSFQNFDKYTRSREYKTVKYLDKVVGQTLAQINALSFVLNEDVDIRDYEDNNFYSRHYSITEEYVRFDIKRMKNTEEILKAQELREKLEPLVNHRELDEDKPPQFYIPTRKPKPTVTPLESAVCNLGELPIVKQTLKEYRDNNEPLWFGN